jgi:hypothetical protein
VHDLGGAGGLLNTFGVAFVPIDICFCASLAVDLKLICSLDAVGPIKPRVACFSSIYVLEAKSEVIGMFGVDGITMSNVG